MIDNKIIKTQMAHKKLIHKENRLIWFYSFKIFLALEFQMASWIQRERIKREK